MNNLELFGEYAAQPLGAVAMAVCERPRNRAKEFGTAALSDVEALALVLQGSGEEPEKAIAGARALVVRFGSLGALLGKTSEQLQACGLPEVLALRVLAALEVSRRVLSAACGEEPLMTRADLVAAYMAPRCAGLEVEKFWVLCLNRKNRLIRCVELTSGTATAALAHPREVFRVAMMESATGIICVHNHPSGDPAPSAPDLHVTRMLRDAAKAIDILLLDHVICGRAQSDPIGRGFWSFREGGML